MYQKKRQARIRNVQARGEIEDKANGIMNELMLKLNYTLS